MNPVFNYVVAALLSIGGLSAYIFNPYRQGSIVVGIVLQAFCIGILFLATIEHEKSAVKYETYAKDQKALTSFRFIVKLVLYILCAFLLIYGIQSIVLRIVLLIVMWIAAISLGETAGYYIWRTRNKALADQMAEQGVRERAEKKEEKLHPQPTPTVQHQNTPEKQDASVRPSGQTRQESSSSVMAKGNTRPRSQSMPDLLLAVRLMNHDASALEEALRHPTAPALAAIEEIICRSNGNPDSVFYRMGGERVYTSISIENKKLQLKSLIAEKKLLDNPAYSQLLIAQLGRQASNAFLHELAATSPAALFEYQLLGVQMQVAHLVGE